MPHQALAAISAKGLSSETIARPNSAVAPDRAPSLGPALKRLVLSGWRVSVGRARYGARPGERLTVRPTIN